jgi:hypothetical protein
MLPLLSPADKLKVTSRPEMDEDIAIRFGGVFKDLPEPRLMEYIVCQAVSAASS